MNHYIIILIVIVSILFLILLTSLICYFKTFYSRNKHIETNEIKLPNNPLYNMFKDQIINDITFGRQMGYKTLTTKSFDNLTLYGKYYESFKDAPIEIMFHGYKGEGERDLSTGIRRAKACGRNVLIVDQRGHGKSEGHTISFGINERFDVLSWINTVLKEFGNDTIIYLCGVSMGAATVMMASSLKLPNNVKGILADCGYDSPKNIIKKYIKDMHLSTAIFYPFVKLGGLLFGHFNLDKASPINSVKNTKVPIIFIHGDNDSFVPSYMSEKLYNTCTSKKQLTIIKGAEHGLSYLFEPDTYINVLNNFFIEKK